MITIMITIISGNDNDNDNDAVAGVLPSPSEQLWAAPCARPDVGSEEASPSDEALASEKLRRGRPGLGKVY